jgi:integrase/recombinase XerC/integrase/recombinase XerD
LEYALESFIIDQKLRGNSDKTIKGYQGFLGRFIAWLALKGIANIEDVVLLVVQQYQLFIDSKPAERSGGEKLSKRSVQTYMRHIKIFMKYCYTEEFISNPIHQKIRIPKAERPTIEILTDDEIDVIFSCFSSKSEIGIRNRAIISLLLDCGLRLSEVVGIKSKNINFEKGYVLVMGKGRKERIVPLGLKVRQAMLKYLHKRRMTDSSEQEEFFFLAKNHKPLTKHGIASLMGRLKKSTGITRLHAHLFRHTFATNFLVHGLGDVYELSRILGHSEMRITEQYLQVASYYTIMEKRRRLSYLDKKEN